MRAAAMISAAALATLALFPPSAEAFVGPHHQVKGRAAPLRARAEAGRSRSHGRGFVNLVGDRDSGLGFYALPRQYRSAGAERGRPGDAIRYAGATQAGTSDY